MSEPNPLCLLDKHYEFYRLIATWGLFEPSSFCPINQVVRSHATRLSRSGVWIHFDNGDTWFEILESEAGSERPLIGIERN